MVISRTCGSHAGYTCSSNPRRSSMRMVKVLGLIALIAAPLAAQQQPKPASTRPRMGPGMMGHGPEMMGQEMMGPMMRTMAFAPGHLLDRKDALELTPQQVTRLTAIRDAAKTAHDAAMDEAKTHLQELARVMQAAAPDTNAAKTHFQAAHAAMGKAHWAMLAAAAQTRAALNDAQRGRVDGWADAMMMQRHHRN